MKSDLAVSVVVPLHSEGRLFHRTKLSIENAVQYAQNHGVSCEVIMVLDKATPQTISYVENCVWQNVPVTIAYVDYGNPGLARNHGVQLAGGKYIALVDADNLFSKNWLKNGTAMVEKYGPDIVVHPKYVVGFGNRQYYIEAIGTDNKYFDPYAMAEMNYWDTMCITSTDILKRFPYHPANIAQGFGYEDWHWNCQTLAAGVEHRTAPKTSLFYRGKAEGSMHHEHVRNVVLLPPTDFLRPDVIDRYQKQHHRPCRPRIPKTILESDTAQRPRFYKPIRSTFLWTMRKGGKYPYKLLRPMAKTHHRAREFESQLRPMVQKLFRPPGMPSQPALKPKHTLPAWLIEDWRQVHDIEPRTFPQKALLPYLPQHRISSNLQAQLYWKLARELGASLDYLMLVPWLKKGGADLEVINYVKAIKKINPSAKITILATNETSSPWRKQLPEGVNFVKLDKRVHWLAVEHQVQLLGTLFLQLEPKRIHLINSWIGYEVFIKHAKALSTSSKLYLSIFCIDRTKEGQKSHYVFGYLESMFEHLTKIFADNKNVVDELVALYDFPPNKFTVHYQPYSGKKLPIKSAAQVPKKFTKKQPLKILWAGRLDAQKRPDILIKIYQDAKKQKLPIEFNVYGAPLLSSKKYLRAIKKQAGIKYHGPFDKLTSLPLDKYHLFLMSSEWEGLPNVLLEATAGQLPIIAPAVGGVPEFIESGQTGYLVKDYDNISQYMAAIKDALLDYTKTKTYLKNAQTIMASKHSWKSFYQQLQEDEGFIAAKLPKVELINKGQTPNNKKTIRGKNPSRVNKKIDSLVNLV